MSAGAGLEVRPDQKEQLRIKVQRIIFMLTTVEHGSTVPCILYILGVRPSDVLFEPLKREQGTCTNQVEMSH